MFNKKHRFIAMLTVLLLATLSSMTPETNKYWSLLCEVTGGSWEFTQEFQNDGRCNREKLVQVEAPTEADQDSLEFDIASCLPKPTDYTLEIINISDDTTPKGKRSCNADGNLTNNSDQKLMFNIYRVNNYGADETKYPEGKWMGSGYQIVAPGETIEYGRFHHCTGGDCGEGEWFYIERISIMYYTPECSQYSFINEEKVPESIANIENPCNW
ncbi:MAG: hypothetical protein HQ574_00825 [Chloroflexi bacterium]|nr:hypothetical protein [Chloroflexota bacterium]